VGSPDGLAKRRLDARCNLLEDELRFPKISGVSPLWLSYTSHLRVKIREKKLQLPGNLLFLTDTN
jgi:hypothetical protein